MDARKTLKSMRQNGPIALRPGEVILGQAVISQGIYWKSVAVFILALLIGFLWAWQVGAFLTVVATLMLVFAGIIQKILMLVVTDQRVVTRTGTILVETVDLRLDRIESVELQRTLVGQVLGYSSVVITGTGTRLAFIPFVANGTHIRTVIDEILYKREQTPLTVHNV